MRARLEALLADSAQLPLTGTGIEGDADGSSGDLPGRPLQH
jgi:hypothetical protein